jgi:hypothetical protein
VTWPGWLSDADLARAERLGGAYMRFEGAIYAESRPIEIADPRSFRVLDPWYAIDDRHIYFASGSYWRIVSSPFHHRSETPSVVDRASFEPLGHGFARDAARIYWHNDVLAGVSRPTFAPLTEHFARDDRSVFYFYSGIHRTASEAGQYLGILPITLAGADPRTFVALNDYCGKDHARAFWHSAPMDVRDVASLRVLDDRVSRSATQVFYEESELEGADAATFELIAGTPYARDKASVYQSHESDYGNAMMRVDGADPRAFEPLGWGYTRRGRQIFIWDRPIDGVDLASFAVLVHGYARDARRLYHPRPAESIIAGDDPDSLVVIDEAFAKTAEHVYFHGGLVPDMDPHTFERRGEYAIDAGHVWLQYGEEGEHLLELAGAEPTTLVIGPHEIARTSTHVYVFGRPVVGADPATFERVSARYGRDQRHVFVLEGEPRTIDGADPASFVELDGAFARDALRVYRIDGGSMNVLPGADPGTFVRINDVFSKDATHVYGGNEAIPDADPDTLEVQGHHARDRRRVYRHELGRVHVVEGATQLPDDDDLPF